MKNRCQKNTWFSTQFFLDFSWFWLPKTTPKSMVFRYFFENVDFVKIVLPSRRNCYFSCFGRPKNDPKSMPKRIRKKQRKKPSQKSMLASILASQNRPRSRKIAPKRDVKRSLFRDAMQTARTLTEVNGPQRL